MRAVLRERREKLGLTIVDTENIAGLAADHLAKFERPGVERQRTVQIAMGWAGALKFELVLGRIPLPRLALSIIADTRD